MKDFIDYYKLLGVDPAATQNEIKRAYHDYARTFHPDLHHGRESEERAKRIFQEISEAYFILSDPDLKEEYDRKRYRRPVFLERRRAANAGPAPGGDRKGYRRRVWTRYPAVNFVIDAVELGLMLLVLAGPFLAPFILILIVLMFFRY